MKRSVIIFLLAILSSLLPTNAFPLNDTTFIIDMQKQIKEKKSLDNEGRRTPPIQVRCEISKVAGIKIDGLSEDILNYEIWDFSSKICMASFTEESELIDYLFMYSGIYPILIILETDVSYIIGVIDTD